MRVKQPWSFLIHTLRSRALADYDNMVGIQGERGSGKSTLALRIALSMDPGFSIENVFYDIKEIQRIEESPKRGVFVLDEGTNIAFNRTWQNKQQSGFMQLLNVVRQRNHTLIWCAPNLERMDLVVRGDIIKYRLSVLHRGYAKLESRQHDYTKGITYWKMIGMISFKGLRWHPIWPDYENRKTTTYNAAKYLVGRRKVYGEDRKTRMEKGHVQA